MVLLLPILLLLKHSIPYTKIANKDYYYQKIIKKNKTVTIRYLFFKTASNLELTILFLKNSLILFGNFYKFEGLNQKQK